MSIPSPISIERHRLAVSARVALGLVVLFGSAAPAFAEPTSQERTLAAALFQEGRDLMTKGNYKEACPKFAESQRLDPGGGTLLNLALCHEREGKIATAWTEFREALSIARRDKRPEREKAALAEIEKIEPSLSRISLLVPAEARTESLSIKLDGVDFPEAAWGTKVPIDPGEHSVVVSAPGRKNYETTVAVGASASDKSVTIPRLELLPEGAAPLAPPTPSASQQPSADTVTPPPSSVQKTLGYVVGGVGLVGIGLGSAFGVMAISKRSDSDKLCSTATCSGPTGQEAVSLNEDAQSFATISNIGFGVGIVGLVAGTVLVLTAPKQNNVKVGFSVDPRGGGMSVAGAF